MTQTFVLRSASYSSSDMGSTQSPRPADSKSAGFVFQDDFLLQYARLEVVSGEHLQSAFCSSQPSYRFGEEYKARRPRYETVRGENFVPSFFQP